MTKTKSQIVFSIFQLVSEVTEIDSNIILSKSRTAEVVDARYLLVHLLHKQGFYLSSIAKIMGLSRRAVEKIFAGFEDRKASRGRALFGRLVDIAEYRLRKSCEQSAE